MAGLEAIYGGRTNPYERRLAVSGAVARDSGFAKPFIMQTMGRDLRSAESWDDEQMAAYTKAHTDEQNKANALKVLTMVTELAKDGSPDSISVGNAMLEAEGKVNPFIQSLGNVKLVGKNENGWTLIQSGNTVGYFNLNGFLAKMAELQKSGSALTEQSIQEAMKLNWAPLNEITKKSKPPESRERKEGDKIITEKWDSEKGEWVVESKAERWDPSAGKGKERTGSDIDKDIRLTASALNAALGGTLTKTILEAKVQDPVLKKALKKMDNEEAKVELRRVLQHYKEEYRTVTGNEWEDIGSSPSAATKGFIYKDGKLIPK